jgi:hypothetical protein
MPNGGTTITNGWLLCNSAKNKPEQSGKKESCSYGVALFFRQNMLNNCLFGSEENSKTNMVL